MTRGRALVGWLYRARLLLSTVAVAGAVMLAPLANVTRVDNDITAWFSRDDPLYRDYERFRAEFGGTQPLVIAVRSDEPDSGAPGAGLFTRERLAWLKQVSEDLVQIRSVHRIQSLATAHILRAAGSLAAGDPADQSIDYQPLLDPARRSPADSRALAVTDPVLRGALVSADGNVTALIVTFDEPGLERDRTAILDEIYRTVGARLPPGLSVYYNGSIEISETYNRVTISNQRRFIPPILALTLIAVYVLFRSFRHAVIVLLSIVVSALWTVGLYSALGFGFNILTAMLTPLVVVLAISDDVHLIQQYELERRTGNAEHAFTATIAYLWAPLLAASGTTALGLLSLATSDVLAVRHFGIGAALGVMIDFAVSIVLVPTFLGFLSPLTDRGEPPHERLLGPLRHATSFATTRPRLVLAAGVVLTLAAATGLSRLRIDTNHIGFFASGHPLTRSAAVIDGAWPGSTASRCCSRGNRIR